MVRRGARVGVEENGDGGVWRECGERVERVWREMMFVKMRKEEVA